MYNFVPENTAETCIVYFAERWGYRVTFITAEEAGLIAADSELSMTLEDALSYCTRVVLQKYAAIRYGRVDPQISPQRCRYLHEGTR